MPKRLLEQLSGVGDIEAGELVLRSTSYQLDVWSEDTDERAHPRTIIDGHIDISGIGEAAVLAGPETLTLKLADGRRLPFAITDTAGRIVGRGALRSA